MAIPSAARSAIPVRLYGLVLILSVPVAVATATEIGNQDITYGAGFSLLLAIAGIVQAVHAPWFQGRRSQRIMSIGLACYLAFVVVGEPLAFRNFDGRTATGLLIPAGWLVPIILAGMWFARRRYWFQAIAALGFLFVSESLIARNMHFGESGFLEFKYLRRGK
jgi:hypothetical protein